MRLLRFGACPPLVGRDGIGQKDIPTCRDDRRHKINLFKKERAASVCGSLDLGLARLWWAGTESNRRHKDFQSFALPTELPALSK